MAPPPLDKGNEDSGNEIGWDTTWCMKYPREGMGIYGSYFGWCIIVVLVMVYVMLHVISHGVK